MSRKRQKCRVWGSSSHSSGDKFTITDTVQLGSLNPQFKDPTLFMALSDEQQKKILNTPITRQIKFSGVDE